MGGPYLCPPLKGKINIRLQFQYRDYTKADLTPKQVKPIPIQVLHYIAGITAASNGPRIQATFDIIILALFFLLRPS